MAELKEGELTIKTTVTSLPKATSLMVATTEKLLLIFMRIRFLTLVFCFFVGLSTTSQANDIFPNPKVRVTVTLSKNAFKLGEDIQLAMALTNEAKQIQSVWFDRPKFSTGGPACTSVALINAKTGESVLEYQNKMVLVSQVYSQEQIRRFSYQLKLGQTVKNQFSLYDMVVVKNGNSFLSKGEYVMQVFYYSNASAKISFTVD